MMVGATHGNMGLYFVALFAVAPFVVGYLFGSIPFGVILTRSAGLGDVRKIGSGNIGATNVLRTGHKGLALATLLGDALKGTAAIFLVAYVFGKLVAGPQSPETHYFTGAFTAFGAFIGHLYPVWLRFKGGKGVATFLGCLIGLCFPAALVFGAVWLGIAFLTRYSSLAALVASVVSTLSLFYFSPTSLMGFEPASFVAYAGLAMVVLLWWKHRENIKRLMAGTEGKIGQKG